MRCSSLSVRGAGLAPSLLSSLPLGIRACAFPISASTRAWPRAPSQECRQYATDAAAPTVKEMVKAYRKVTRKPLNIQQVVKVEPEAVLDDGSIVFVHREQPVYAPPGPLPEFRDLTAEELKEIVKLRKKDPETWTVTALSEKYRVSRGLITTIAPLTGEHEERLKERLEEEAFLQSLSRPKYKGIHHGRQGGLKLNKQRILAKAKFQKMVEEAGGLKNLMRAQNFVTHHTKKRPVKNRPRRMDAEPLFAGETDDAPMKTLSELDSLLDWVSPQDNVRTLLENRVNIFKMNEDKDYKPPGPIPKATPPPPAGGKPAAAPAGGKPAGGAPAGKQAPPPKKK